MEEKYIIQNQNIDLAIETLGQIDSTLRNSDSRKIDIELIGDLLKNHKIKECKVAGSCPACNTHNEAWIKRLNVVNQELVYCWHCGKRVLIKKGGAHE